MFNFTTVHNSGLGGGTSGISMEVPVVGTPKLLGHQGRKEEKGEGRKKKKKKKKKEGKKEAKFTCADNPEYSCLHNIFFTLRKY